MKLKGKRIFVSGAAGVIGNELIQKLSRKGAIILAADRKKRPANFPQSILYRQGDLNYITKAELNAFHPEVFFHLAASFERSTESYEFWQENFQDNILLSHHLITLVKDAPYFKKVIFPSSYLIYNEQLYSFDKPQKNPKKLIETDPIYPRNLTGSAKLNHEIELNFIKIFKPKVQVVLARIYRGYGRNSRDVISRWVRALLSGKAISVYHKENIFDYIYAEDTAEGLMRLAESNFNGVVNLGTGRSQKIENVISALKVHFPKLEARYENIDLPYEASEADTTKLKKVIGWVPKHTLKMAISKIVEFEKGRQIVEEERAKNVLITSISKKVPMIEAVKWAGKKISPEIKVFGGDINSEAIGRYFVDRFYKMDRLGDKGVGKIVNYCKKNNIGSIIPSRDGELAFWAKHQKTLYKKGISVMVSGDITVETSLDKLKFYEELKKKNFPAIVTSTDIQSIKSKKYVVKERFGAGSESIGLNLDYNQAISHSQKLTKPIFQPFVKGQEYSVDVYVALTGEVKGAIARKRTLVVKGESQITETLTDEKLEKICSACAKTLGIYGHAIFQIIKNNSGYFIIECNVRFGGASTLAISAGLDSFYWFLLEASGEDISSYPFIKPAGKLKQVRYPKDYFLCEKK